MRQKNNNVRRMNLIRTKRIGHPAAFACVGVENLKRHVRRFINKINNRGNEAIIVTEFTTRNVIVNVSQIRAYVTMPNFIGIRAVKNFFRRVLHFFDIVARTIVNAINRRTMEQFLPSFIFNRQTFASFLLRNFELRFLQVS